MNKAIQPTNNLSGVISVPGDKSISHRAVMFGAIASGTTEISGFLTGDDCLSTIACFKKLGVDIEVNGNLVTVHGVGLHGLRAPTDILDVGNSGTTLRLITGLLSAQPFSCELTGDATIQKRPMDRVLTPLQQMGAQISGRDGTGFAPINICGGKLTGISYTLPVASAQVKSSILLAGLYAKTETTVVEPLPTRDHTEIMLNYFGADITNNNGAVTCRPVAELYGKPVAVPGDISSAAFFIVAALIIPGANITITNVGVNPTRTGIIDALRQMGADIRCTNERTMSGEPVADIEVNYSRLNAITLEGDIIPRMIDEIPVFAVAATHATGTSVIRDAAELKVKESNRIKTIVEELTKMGAVIEETTDGMIITGGNELHGAEVETYNDHRIAMSMAIAALSAKNSTNIKNAEVVDISYPGFFEVIEKVSKN